MRHPVVEFGVTAFRIGPFLIQELTHLLNLCLTCKAFPRCLKIEIVKPIFKSGLKTQFTNYRPISILPTISKVLERIIYNQLLAFLQINNSIYDFQFGFRTKHSTYMPVSLVYDYVTTSLLNKQAAIGIYLDLKKAFDTVHHEILLRKLVKYGISNDSLKIFKSYLSNRSQSTRLECFDVSSGLESITTGVPQGAILAPLLFSIYINDFHRISNIPKSYLFADDCALMLASDSLQSVEQTANSITPLIYDWLCANRLTLNVSKTYYQIYSHVDDKPDINISINSQKINRASTVRYLGVILDERLNWKAHIARTRNTVARNIGLISRAKYILNKPLLILLYQSLVLPYLSYCAFIWGSNYPTNLISINRIQKRIVRVIEGSHHRAESSPIFKKLELLKFTDLVVQQKLLIMHSFLNGYMPESYADNFEIWHPNRETRQILHFEQPFADYNYCAFSFKIACPQAWNEVIAPKIPNLADIPVTKQFFKKVLKKNIPRNVLNLLNLGKD